MTSPCRVLRVEECHEDDDEEDGGDVESICLVVGSTVLEGWVEIFGAASVTSLAAFI